MNPLVKQIKEHKSTMEKRLETLRRISESRDTLDARIKELDASLRETRKQLDTLHHLHDALRGKPHNSRFPPPQSNNPVTAEAAV